MASIVQNTLSIQVAGNRTNGAVRLFGHGLGPLRPTAYVEIVGAL